MEDDVSEDPKLPSFLCPRCFALLMDPPGDSLGQEPARCNYCRLEFVMPDGSRAADFNTSAWLANEGYALDLLGDLDRHVGRKGVTPSSRMPAWILDTILAAQHFIHIASFSVDSVTLGWLQVVSRRVPVRVLYGKAPVGFTSELLEGLAIVRANLDARHIDGLHQKLIVVDGLVALTGSANLTWRAMQALADGREHVKVDTSINNVVDLNNRLFSKHWGGSSKLGKLVVLTENSSPAWSRRGEKPPTSAWRT